MDFQKRSPERGTVPDQNKTEQSPQENKAEKETKEEKTEKGAEGNFEERENRKRRKVLVVVDLPSYNYDWARKAGFDTFKIEDQANEHKEKNDKKVKEIRTELAKLCDIDKDQIVINRDSILSSVHSEPKDELVKSLQEKPLGKRRVVEETKIDMALNLDGKIRIYNIEEETENDNS